MSPYVVGRCEDFYENPLEFIPERFFKEIDDDKLFFYIQNF